MTLEVQIDDKGRIVIPIEIREKFNLKTGEKIQIFVEEEGIILKPKLSTEELVKKLKKFRSEIAIRTDKPFKIKKLFEE